MIRTFLCLDDADYGDEIEVRLLYEPTSDKESVKKYAELLSVNHIPLYGIPFDWLPVIDGYEFEPNTSNSAKTSMDTLIRPLK